MNTPAIIAGRDKNNTLSPFKILNDVSSVVDFSLALKKLNPKYLENIILPTLNENTMLSTEIIIFVTLCD